MTIERYRQSAQLAGRAAKIVAGGHHLSGRVLVEGQPPIYMARGQGGRVWDADGNEYLDLLLAFGAVLLGYADPDVDGAAMAQAREGNLLSLNHSLHVRFVERLLELFPFADMGLFVKTGSEATTAALRIARRATGRRRVIRCGYHGWHDWCLPVEPFVPAGLEDQVLEIDAKRPVESLRDLLSKHRPEVAAVILAPEMILPLDAEIFRGIASLTRAAGAVFVLDEVKTAFRTRTGAIHTLLGFTPDVLTISKALGNGWPVAAVLGTRAVMEHARGLHCSATYHGETTGMAAALAAIELMQQRNVADHVDALGRRLLAGLDQLIAAHQLPFVAYPEPIPAMPFLRVSSDDPRLRDRLTSTFFASALDRGVLLHPRHLWFLAASHRDDDIDRVLEVADHAMSACAAALDDVAR